MAGKTKYTTYVEPYLHEIKEWARQGDTYKSIAKKLHIGYRTFIGYLERGEKGEEPFLQLLQCFVRGEQDAIESIENALKKRAEGYQWEKVVKVYKRDKMTGEMCLAEERHEMVDVPPDPTSIQFYLINRKRADWQKERKEVIQDERDDLGVIVLPEIKE